MYSGSVRNRIYFIVLLETFLELICLCQSSLSACIRQQLVYVMVGMTLLRRPPERKPRGRHPQNALTSAFVRNVSRAGRYCDGKRPLP